jgi:16S rRNA (adenine1518-N6/adenine1519-N6)-dimethyltransferase
MTSHSEILAHYHIEPKKSLGQNFLTQDSILEGIAGVIEVTGKHIIEVGPGYGALTEKLLALKPASLTLVEYDTKMVEILEDRLKRGDFPLDGATEFTIHKGDVLAFHPERESVIIANIPYYITSPILFRFLYEVDFTPSEMVILMQKEVGDKIRETKEFGRSYFSLACKRKCSSIKECFKVAAGNFFPPPKVESTVLHFSNIIKKNSINGSGDE